MPLTHIDARGDPRMVDVSTKAVTKRTALAQAVVAFDEPVWQALQACGFTTAKGPIFHTAIVAGTMAAKQTSDLIPFCHPLPIDNCEITCKQQESAIVVRCKVETTAKTGIEMEALTGASVAALTLYDMVKALGPGTIVRTVELRKKSGGKTDYLHPDERKENDASV
ncbi:MAG: cyclic pyranopterin monophosphate synthase MoaC [Opitutales bacterium]